MHANDVPDFCMVRFCKRVYIQIGCVYTNGRIRCLDRDRGGKVFSPRPHALDATWNMYDDIVAEGGVIGTSSLKSHVDFFSWSLSLHGVPFMILVSTFTGRLVEISLKYTWLALR